MSLFAQSSYYTHDISAADSTAYVVAMVGFFIFALIAVTITYVVTSLLLSRIFKKAGIEGWKAWVPIYNNWVLLELGEQKGYWAVLAIIPFVNIVSAIFMLIAMHRIGIGFGKDGTFVLVAIFLPLVWYIWLALDHSTWKGPRQVSLSTNSRANNPGSPTNPTVK
jgi:uncharacterized protein DUF5684